MNTNENKTVLLVEDDPLISHTISRSVKRAGYNFITLDSGEKAISLISGDTGINLVLIDH